MATKVAIFGGGFNPIGLHHEEMGNLIKWRMDMQTWFMPCYTHRFEKNDELIEAAHRWNMVTEVVAQSPGWLAACDWEIAHQHNGSMYETMQALTALHPDKEFHIVVGMDNANVVETEWDRGSLLIQRFPFIVFLRRGLKPKVDWFKQEPHTIIPFSDPSNSTAIRKAIREGKHRYARRHLNPRVWDYIQTGKFYGYHERKPKKPVHE